MEVDEIQEGQYYTDGSTVRRVIQVGPSHYTAYPIHCAAGEVSYAVVGEFPGGVEWGTDELGPVSVEQFARWTKHQVAPTWEIFE